jgi:PIN domain nuclease of toxin-antitoxin system
MDYVTDTHSILWYFTEDPRLSKRAFDVFEGTVREGFIIIPAVVLAEIMFIAKKGRITLTFEETLKKIERYENFDLAPLDVDILKVANKIEADLEMHDRLIVATALYFNATLLTSAKLTQQAPFKNWPF